MIKSTTLLEFESLMFKSIKEKQSMLLQVHSFVFFKKIWTQTDWYSTLNYDIMILNIVTSCQFFK